MALVAGAPLVGSCASPPLPVDVDPQSGFALYRSGRLSAAELRQLCELGVEEILVLDGTAGQRECEMRARNCPQLRVRYNGSQKASVALSGDFLKAFDQWIREAQDAGKRVAFRCRHGWHRAGRLTAYYQMRYSGMSSKEATQVMNRVGQMMWRHPYLAPQVGALEDFILDRGCQQEPRHCVLPPAATDRRAVLFLEFPDDACPEL